MVRGRRLVLEEGHHELRAAKAARFAAWLAAHPHYGQPQDTPSHSRTASFHRTSGLHSPFGSVPASPATGGGGGGGGAGGGGVRRMTPELRSPVLATVAALAGCEISDDGRLPGGSSHMHVVVLALPSS